MDSHNRFETAATFRLARLEWLAFLATSVVLALRQLGEIRWWIFVGLFVVIDVVGYLPGAIAFRRSATGVIRRRFYILYNVAHSLVTGGLVVAAWSLLVRPEWALLAVPIHLFGDRAIFGNSFKSFGVPFEPKTHPAFAVFERDYGGARHQERTIRGIGA
jgi:hypothetical protein